MPSFSTSLSCFSFNLVENKSAPAQTLSSESVSILTNTELKLLPREKARENYRSQDAAGWSRKPEVTNRVTKQLGQPIVP